jgi:hypothetical protein
MRRHPYVKFTSDDKSKTIWVHRDRVVAIITDTIHSDCSNGEVRATVDIGMGETYDGLVNFQDLCD